MFKPDSSAFAAFSTPLECHTAARILDARVPGEGLSLGLSDPNVKPSPHYDDVIWANVGQSIAAKNARRLIFSLAYIGITIGWFVYPWLIYPGL
jgi:hypothetical protein